MTHLHTNPSYRQDWPNYATLWRHILQRQHTGRGMPLVTRHRHDFSMSVIQYSHCRKVGSSLGGKVEDTCYSRTSDICHPGWCKVQDSTCQSPVTSHSARHPQSDRLRPEPHHLESSNSGASHHYRRSCQ